MRWYRKTSSTSRFADWKREFGPEYDVPKEVEDLVRKGVAEDMSWYDDVYPSTPSFGIVDDDGQEIRIWVDHPDPSRRRDPQGRRFVVTELDQELAHTDDVNGAIAEYLKASGSGGTKPATMNLESIQERMYDLSRKREKTLEDRAEMEELKRLHEELHPEKRKAPRFMAGRKGWYRRALRKSAGWVEEFGPEYDVPKEILDLVGKGLAEDHSWHNDIAPSFGKKVPVPEDKAREILIWVEHPDPAKREYEKRTRFFVWDSWQDDAFDTDDVNEAIRAYLDATGQGPTKGRPIALESVQERMYDLTRKPGRMTPEEDAEMRELRKRHRELHPEKRELPKFLAGRKGTTK